MDLLSIQDPSFLKNMSIDELEKLSDEIRQFLITTLSASGGHIGPNLGVVELTVALHKEFNSPKDKFLWDVGHQSYVHKLLTGRGKEFATLRQYKGLCGFPKRSESEHDVWETGHSSTSLSGAMGMAAARDIKGTDEFIIPIIGDGALTGGMALEALNHIGDEKKDMIVILNDNEMSIAPNVGAIHSMLGRLRTAGKYQWVKDELEYLFKKIPAVGGKLAATAERVKDSLKYMLVSGMFFEELGFTYLGPVDGHSYHELIENLQYAKNGFIPCIAIAAAIVAACCSAIPTSNMRSGNSFAKPSSFEPTGIAGVMATTRSSSRAIRCTVPLTRPLHEGAAAFGFTKSPVLILYGPVPCHVPIVSVSAGLYPFPFFVMTCRRTGPFVFLAY